MKKLFLIFLILIQLNIINTAFADPVYENVAVNKIITVNELVSSTKTITGSSVYVTDGKIKGNAFSTDNNSLNYTNDSTSSVIEFELICDLAAYYSVESLNFYSGTSTTDPSALNIGRFANHNSAADLAIRPYIKKIEYFDGSGWSLASGTYTNNENLIALTEGFKMTFSAGSIFYTNKVKATIEIHKKNAGVSDNTIRLRELQVIAADIRVPAVTLLNPQNNSIHFLENPLELKASAEAFDDSEIVSVEFYKNNEKIDGIITENNGEYSLEASFSRGNYDVYARAVDSNGLSSRTAAVNITVKSINSPVINIIHPENNYNSYPNGDIYFEAEIIPNSAELSEITVSLNNIPVLDMGALYKSGNIYFGTITNVQEGASEISVTAVNDRGDDQTVTLSITAGYENIALGKGITSSVQGDNAQSSTSYINNGVVGDGLNGSIFYKVSDQNADFIIELSDIYYIDRINLHSGYYGNDFARDFKVEYFWENSWHILNERTENTERSCLITPLKKINTSRLRFTFYNLSDVQGSRLRISEIEVYGGRNSYPYIEIDNESNNKIVPSNAVFKVRAEDYDGSVSGVMFYDNAIYMGQAVKNGNLFEYQSDNLALGSHIIYAEAEDNRGLKEKSDSIKVVVSNLMSIINYINGTADLNAVKNRLDENKESLSAEGILYADYDLLSEKNKIINNLINKNFSNDVSGLQSFIDTFNKGILAEKVNASGNTEEIRAIIEGNADILGIDISEESDYNTLVNKAKIYSFFSRKNDINNIADIFNELTAVSHIEEAYLGNIASLLEKYELLLSINTAYKTSLNTTKKAALYEYTAGEVFADKQDFNLKFSQKLSSLMNQSEGGGSSGGSAGNGGGGNITAVIPAEEVKPHYFNDLEAVEWAKESIYGLLNLGAISNAEKFNPGNYVTREEFVKMLVMLTGGSDKSFDCSFSDVPKDNWAYSYIATAVKRGIITGISENEFGLGKMITRQDIAVIIYRSMEKSNEASELDFKDSNDISDYAKEAVSKIKQLGIINGTPEGMFLPKNSATRAEAAKMLYGLQGA